MFTLVKESLESVGLTQYLDHFHERKLNDASVTVCLRYVSLRSTLEKAIPVKAHLEQFIQAFNNPNPKLNVDPNPNQTVEQRSNEVLSNPNENRLEHGRTTINSVLIEETKTTQANENSNSTSAFQADPQGPDEIEDDDPTEPDNFHLPETDELNFNHTPGVSNPHSDTDENFEIITSDSEPGQTPLPKKDIQDVIGNDFGTDTISLKNTPETITLIQISVDEEFEKPESHGQAKDGIETEVFETSLPSVGTNETPSSSSFSKQKNVPKNLEIVERINAYDHEKDKLSDGFELLMHNDDHGTKVRDHNQDQTQDQGLDPETTFGGTRIQANTTQERPSSERKSKNNSSITSSSNHVNASENEVRLFHALIFVFIVLFINYILSQLINRT